MKIDILASSSSGNAYIISDGETKLLLEAGLPLKKLMELSGYSITQCSACLISHEHKDHARSAFAVAVLGLKMIMSEGTLKGLNEPSMLWHKAVKERDHIEVGTFIIVPFNVQHDAAEPLGFLIYSKKTKEKLVFATDTFYVKQKFSGLTHIMVECNYDIDTLNENVAAGLIDPAQKRRLLSSHFELHNVIKFLEANDLSKVDKIYLMHLSGNNAERKRFLETIQKLTGKEVLVC